MTQGERQSFNWRPNTNDSQTLARYDQEAQHWARAFKNAESRNKKTSLNETLGFIGLVFSLIFSLIGLLSILLVRLINWLRSS